MSAPPAKNLRTCLGAYLNNIIVVVCVISNFYGCTYIHVTMLISLLYLLMSPVMISDLPTSTFWGKEGVKFGEISPKMVKRAVEP